MGNMGYCRFENTLEELRDCVEHLDDDLTGTEATSRERILNICRDLAIQYRACEEIYVITV